ncbi:hypothetical protein [Quadrisphaera sp. KR29]|uniref:hypothetical protein n=1 Tax=Quadrisphaera sp. KR29 TaxID=3461391 RepID=UPI0040448795
MAPPTGAPGLDHEPPADRGDGGDGWLAGPAGGGRADAEDERRWAAEAERLRSERPPHWG